MEYKRRIKDKLYNDNIIPKAILNDKSNFLKEPTKTAKKTMMKKNIFTYFLNPKVITEKSSYIMMAFKFNYVNVAIEEVGIVFRIYTHKDFQDTGNDYDRNDFICTRLKEIFNKNVEFGIGELQLKSSFDLDPLNENFVVHEMFFKTHTFS